MQALGLADVGGLCAARHFSLNSQPAIDCRSPLPAYTRTLAGDRPALAARRERHAPGVGCASFVAPINYITFSSHLFPLVLFTTSLVAFNPNPLLAAWATLRSAMCTMKGSALNSAADRGHPTLAAAPSGPAARLNLPLRHGTVPKVGPLEFLLNLQLARRSSPAMCGHLKPNCARSLASCSRQDVRHGSNAKRNLTSVLSLKRMPV